MKKEFFFSRSGTNVAEFPKQNLKLIMKKKKIYSEVLGKKIYRTKWKGREITIVK